MDWWLRYRYRNVCECKREGEQQVRGVCAEGRIMVCEAAAGSSASLAPSGSSFSSTIFSARHKETASFTAKQHASEPPLQMTHILPATGHLGRNATPPLTLTAYIAHYPPAQKACRQEGGRCPPEQGAALSALLQNPPAICLKHTLGLMDGL